MASTAETLANRRLFYLEPQPQHWEAFVAALDDNDANQPSAGAAYAGTKHFDAGPSRQRRVSQLQIKPLQVSHAVEWFDCGVQALNRFLGRFALANQQAQDSRILLRPSGAMPWWASTRWWWGR